MRFYKYKPEIGSLVNYGAFPQTYEDPKKPDALTKLPGDGDPLDVLDIYEQQVKNETLVGKGRKLVDRKEEEESARRV